MAQTPYVVVTDDLTYEPLDDGIAFSPGLGDGDTRRLGLPFTFSLYGTPTTEIYVNANGFVATSAIGPGFHFPALDNPQPALEPNGFIAPFWADWCASVDSPCEVPAPLMSDIGVRYRIDTSSVTIEWRHLRHYRDVQAPSSVSFQLVLHEGPSGQIELRYGPAIGGIDFFGEETPFEARIGIESPSGNEGMWVGPCAAQLACTAGHAQSLANKRITIVADAGEDLSVGSVSAPENVFAGLPFELSFRLFSRHGQPIGPFKADTFFVPHADSSTASAVFVGRTPDLWLAPFETRTVTLTTPVPQGLPPGRYKVFVVIDVENSVAETDEHNNTDVGTQLVRVLEQAPDLVLQSIKASPGVAAPGDPITVVFAVENAGTVLAQSGLRLKLSDNDTISNNDLNLSPLIDISLLPRSSKTTTVTVALPLSLPSGRYFVGGIIDESDSLFELSETNNGSSTEDPILVSSGELRFLTTSLPPGLLTQLYSARIEAVAGAEAVEVRLLDGRLPVGMAFDGETNEIYGFPLETGRFMLLFSATAQSKTETRVLELSIFDPEVPLTLVTSQLAPLSFGHDSSLDLFAVGGEPPYTWRVIGLPEGLVVAPEGRIEGVPTEVGTFNLEVSVRDGASAFARQELTLEVRPPPNLQITSLVLPTAALETPYEALLFATGGTGPVLWQAVGELPAGLVLSEEGLLSGRPEHVSEAIGHRFIVEAVDGRGSRDRNELRLVVTDAGHQVSIVTEALPFGSPSRDYRARIEAAGGKPPYDWELFAGVLPPGFSVEAGDPARGESSEDLIISGRLEREGIWSFAVTVTDTQGLTSSRPFALISEYPRGTRAAEASSCQCADGRPTGSLVWFFVVISLAIVLLSKPREVFVLARRNRRHRSLRRRRT